MKINYFPLFTVKNFNTTLNSSRVNIGCDIDEVDNAFNHLNGKIEMFGYSYSVLTNDEMNEILDSDGMISIDKRYDDNKKLIEKVITTNNNKLFVKYRYNKNAPTSELRELVSSELHSNGEETIYEYDFLGNVVKSATISKGMPNDVSLSFIKGKKYLYDDYGRLIEESYYKDSSIILEYNNKYHYDRNGDITSKEMDGIRYEYLYTGHLLTKITNQETEESIYEITYDNMYPKQIKKNNTTYNLLWEGTKLVQYGDNIFTYNEEGQRIRKETANKIYEYIYSNNCLVRCIKRYKETLNIENIIDYHYDEIGQLVGLSYEKNDYYYERDILGNINKIVDKNGEPVVSYEYDAYGNFTKSCVGYIGQILSNNNIFLYKGYCYDVETSLFWLSSRYYSPELCRFISPDSIEYLDPDSISGLNLYCYCLNNPISYADPSGHFAISSFLICLAASWVISSIASYYLGEHFVSGASSIYGGAQTIATGVSLLAYGPVGWVLGGAAIVLGAVNIAFGTAELQQHFTGNNWINDIGITGGLYTGLYIGSSIASAAVSIGGTAYMNSSAGKLAHEIQQNAKHWNKGTFKTKFGTLKYHVKAHGRGLSPTEYTNRALSFYDDYQSLLRPNYSNKYNMMRYIHRNKIGVGYYDELGYIIDFIVRGDL